MSFLGMPGVNFSFLLVRFSTVCDVISHANKRGAKHFLQPGSYAQPFPMNVRNPGGQLQPLIEARGNRGREAVRENTASQRQTVRPQESQLFPSWLLLQNVAPGGCSKQPLNE